MAAHVVVDDGTYVPVEADGVLRHDAYKSVVPLENGILQREPVTQHAAGTAVVPLD